MSDPTKVVIATLAVAGLLSVLLVAHLAVAV